MAKDLFTTLDRCTYCGRPGRRVGSTDLVTCGHEPCESLAYAELQREHARRPARGQRSRYLRAPR